MVKRDFIKHVSLVILLVLGIIGLRVWFFEPVTITRQTANEYLHEKDVIVALKPVAIEHGDFILYEHDGKSYVSRVIALPEETVTYMDDVLYRNEQVVEETYLKTPHVQEYYTEDLSVSTLTNGEFQSVPDGRYLVLNDNRTNRNDSRTFGLIAAQDVVGRLSFRISPLSGFGFIETGLVETD